MSKLFIVILLLFIITGCDSNLPFHSHGSDDCPELESVDYYDGGGGGGFDDNPVLVPEVSTLVYVGIGLVGLVGVGLWRRGKG